MKNTTTIIY